MPTLVAITKADGSALSDAEQIAVPNQLKTLLGAQHPESATWTNDGKLWFRAKKGYLTNDGAWCLAQYGPDRKIRAVNFISKLSDPQTWTKDAYRIIWNGGLSGRTKRGGTDFGTLSREPFNRAFRG